LPAAKGRNGFGWGRRLRWLTATSKAFLKASACQFLSHRRGVGQIGGSGPAAPIRVAGSRERQEAAPCGCDRSRKPPLYDDSAGKLRFPDFADDAEFAFDRAQTDIEPGCDLAILVTFHAQQGHFSRCRFAEAMKGARQALVKRCD